MAKTGKKGGRAKAPARRKPPAQVVGHARYPDRMTATEAARAFGVSRQALSQWKGCPRNEDGSFDLRAIIAWRLEQAKLNAIAECGGDPDTLGENSPQKERLLKLKADEQEMKNGRMRRELVPVAELREHHARAAGLLQRFGEIAERRWGVECRTEFEHHLEQAMDAVGVEGEMEEEDAA